MNIHSPRCVNIHFCRVQITNRFTPFGTCQKICLTYFEICALYFKICPTFFFERAEGEKNERMNKYQNAG